MLKTSENYICKRMASKEMHLTQIHFTNNTISVQFSLVPFSCSVMSDSLPPHELEHARPPCPSPTPGVHPDSHPSSQ